MFLTLSLTYLSVCPTCKQRLGIVLHLLGDGVCHPSQFYNAACCFDAGDCDDPMLSTCPTCKHRWIDWISDGLCDPEIYEFGIDCCWDGGDCHACRLGTTRLNREGSHRMVTCKDQNPANSFNTDPAISLYFPLDEINHSCHTCPQFDKDRGACPFIGDGSCDYEEYNFQSCFDGGDCGCPRCSTFHLLGIHI